jgi:hypothetical protein
VKRILLALLVTSVAATWVGCQQADLPAPVAQTPTSPATNATEPATAPAGTSEFTLVKLSVPNMT